MEVRSNTEQCGSDAVTATAVTTSNNIQSLESKESSDATRAAIEMDPSRTMINDDTKQPLTRDESKYSMNTIH